MFIITLFLSIKSNLQSRSQTIMAGRQSSDMAKFQESLKAAKRVVFLTGAGISAESGIPTFRGAGGLWRTYEGRELASPAAFRDSPSLVWEFYHYRREVAAKAQPNAGHLSIAEYQKRHKSDKTTTIITQNVDNLHARAGSQNILELHGNLYKTRCTKCNDVSVNTDSPICPALANRGAPDATNVPDIPVKDLPHCKKNDCGGLLRPHIVWFGEGLDSAITDRADEAMTACEVCLVVGTSAVVYPAAGYASLAALRGAVVAEFNVETTVATADYQYHFQGPSGQTLPQALAD